MDADTISMHNRGMDLKEEDILGDSIRTHWYYVAKGRAVRQMLKGRTVTEVLDVGAGSGIFSRQLLDASLCLRAVCVDPNYLQEREELHNGNPIRFVRQVAEVSQQLILMMDVLEHVADDTSLLAHYAEQMPSGSTILITVPAFQFLWSGHDVFLEHQRRYTKGMVEDLVHRAGLRTVRIRYFFGILFPIIVVLRLLQRTHATEPKSDLKQYPRWLNMCLIAIHELERVILFPFNTLAGLSVVCVCKKP